MMWKEDVFFLLENPALRSTKKFVRLTYNKSIEST